MKTFPWLVVAALALAQVSASAVDCAKRSVCTNRDGKVCGSDGQTYADKCAFESAYCTDPSAQLYIVSDGICKPAQANAAASIKAAATPAPTTTVDVPESIAVEETKSAATPAPTTFELPAVQEDEDEQTEELSATAEEELSPSTVRQETTANDEPTESTSLSDTTPQEGPEQAADSTTTTTTAQADPSDGSSVYCQMKCPSDWIPVCASDGETYVNECHRLSAKCQNPELTTVRSGACVQSAEEPTTTETPSSSSYPTPQPTTTATATLEVTASGSVRTKCNHICPKVYEPVCGSDAVTYANQCLLDYAACRTGRVVKVADGKCTKRKKGESCVPQLCTSVEDPLCGSDGTTYINTCMFENAQCVAPHLSVLHDGECDEDTKLKCATLTCPKFTECREDEEIDVAYCADICAAERCGEGEECQLLDAECFTAPCSPVATCVSAEVEIY